MESFQLKMAIYKEKQVFITLLLEIQQREILKIIQKVSYWADFSIAGKMDNKGNSADF
jgi:hypothetical protein